jgi:hypothetical protein
LPFCVTGARWSLSAGALESLNAQAPADFVQAVWSSHQRESGPRSERVDAADVAVLVSQFLLLGIDDNLDAFAGYQFTLESGFPEESVKEVIKSIPLVDGSVGVLTPFILRYTRASQPACGLLSICDNDQHVDSRLFNSVRTPGGIGRRPWNEVDDAPLGNISHPILARRH